jgi:hypothetical protein
VGQNIEPGNLTVDDVEAVVRRMKVRLTSSKGVSSADAAAMSRLGLDNASDDSDDD